MRTKRLLCVLLVFCCVVACVCCSDGKNQVMKLSDSNGKQVAVVDQSFMSLWIGLQNYQYSAYISAFEKIGGWQTVVDRQTGKTLDDRMLDEAVETLKRMLCAEYIHDNVYDISFSKEQQNSVDAYIDTLVTNAGGKAALESALSAYGTNIDSLERFLVLSAKQNTLYTTFYSQGGAYEVTDDMKKKYFEENYCIADHIFIDLRGTQKEDGTVIPLTDEQKSAKLSKAEEIYNALSSGVYSFDEAKAQFNEDAYSQQYPFGYFVSGDGTFGQEFESAAMQMKEDELRFVQTSAGYHIILKKPMNGELYKSNGNFSDSLSTIISQNLFVELLETADLKVEINEEALNQLKPSLIKPFDFSVFLAE